MKRTLGGLGNVGPVYSGRVGAAGVAVVKGGGWSWTVCRDMEALLPEMTMSREG